jgi:hypothetical protein
MGEARLNGLHARLAAHGLNPQAVNPQVGATGFYGDSIPLDGGYGLDEVLSLQTPRILLVPETHHQPKVNVAALVQQAVSQDPHGQSLHADTLTKLKHAPADPHEFGV